MAYSTYTTEAIVCGGRDRNTTDRSLLLFTREGGMLYAEARGARREASKQRFALQDFTHIRVSLIRGKVGWRIGSVEAKENYYSTATDRDARGSVVRVVKFLRRFARGEEPITEVYDFTLAALRLLRGSVAERTFVEGFVQVHLLALLGYVALPTLPAPLRERDLTKLPNLFSVEHQIAIETQLTAAIAHSHL